MCCSISTLDLGQWEVRNGTTKHTHECTNTLLFEKQRKKAYLRKLELNSEIIDKN